MSTEHPITPPLELVEQLRNDAPYGIRDAGFTRERHLVFAAYRAGADAELEACLDLMRRLGFHSLENLRNIRRPKPPSLAEQGQRILVENGRTLDGRVELDPEDVVTICAALKRLQELEKCNG